MQAGTMIHDISNILLKDSNNTKEEHRSGMISPHNTSLYAILNTHKSSKRINLIPLLLK